MTVSTAEAANAKALASAAQRTAASDALVEHIDTNLAGRHYADADRAKLEKLRADITGAQAETQAEVQARQELQQAYDDSTFAKKDADPAVKAKQKSLARVRAANKPVMHGKDNLVNTVCQPCIDKEVEAVMDCDTPFYAKYGSGGGPKYKDCHDHTLGAYAGWDELIAAKVKTPSEKNVLVAMSANEGDLDAVQAYDSEIVTLGAMQKTVNPQGQGELPIQLREFRDDPATAAVFERELGSKGYSIGANVIGKNKDGTPKLGSADVLYFTDPKNPAAKPITGPALDQFIQTHADRRADTLGPFRALGRTPEFQKKQVLDFNDRLVNATAKKPAGYVHEIGDYVSLEKASALVLDQDVNRPGYVRTDFGQALDKFYADHPSAPKDPGLWTSAQQAVFEPVITDNYSALRRGTDMLNRAVKLGQAGLSEVPGSLDFPP